MEKLNLGPDSEDKTLGLHHHAETGESKETNSEFKSQDVYSNVTNQCFPTWVSVSSYLLFLARN